MALIHFKGVVLSLLYDTDFKLVTYGNNILVLCREMMFGAGLDLQKIDSYNSSLNLISSLSDSNVFM